MAKGVHDQQKVFSKTEMQVASCKNTSNCLDSSHAGKNKWKRPQRRWKEKQHKEEGDGIKAAIPPDIVEDVLKLMNPKEAVRMSFVCRYWLAPAQACDPTLQPTPWKLALTQSDYHLHFRLQSAADPSIFLKIKPVRVLRSAVTCLGSWHGWLLLRRSLPRDELSLLNPFSRVPPLYLPPCNRLRDVLCVTSDPAAPGCAVIAHDYQSNFLIWRSGDRSWATEAMEGGLGVSCPTVWLKDQLFVLDISNMRLLSLQLNPPYCKDLKVTFCIDMLDPSGERRFLRDKSNHLVEYQGVLLAFHISYCLNDYGAATWQNIKVFRLDWATMAFVEAETIGADWAVFLDGSGAAISVSAQEAGCAAGCVYYSDSYDCNESWSNFSWHCCNFKDRAITSIRNRPMGRFPKNRGQFWITRTIKT